MTGIKWKLACNRFAKILAKSGIGVQNRRGDFFWFEGTLQGTGQSRKGKGSPLPCSETVVGLNNNNNNGRYHVENFYIDKHIGTQ